MYEVLEVQFCSRIRSNNILCLLPQMVELHCFCSPMINKLEESFGLEAFLFL